MKTNDLETPNDTFEGRQRSLVFFAFLFAGVSALGAADLITDISEGASPTHWAIESALLAGGIVGLVVMVRQWFGLRAEAANLVSEKRSLDERLQAKAAQADELTDELAQTLAEAEKWRKEARDLMRGLGIAIESQFDEWDLTDAEKEVALLLLKGLSHKEVANVRDTAPATARQQARSVYQKAGLSGRNDLSAFFLEDLLLPSQMREQDDHSA